MIYLIYIMWALTHIIYPYSLENTDDIGHGYFNYTKVSSYLGGLENYMDSFDSANVPPMNPIDEIPAPNDPEIEKRAVSVLRSRGIDPRYMLCSPLLTSSVKWGSVWRADMKDINTPDWAIMRVVYWDGGGHSPVLQVEFLDKNESLCLVRGKDSH